MQSADALLDQAQEAHLNAYCEGTPENLINGIENVEQVVFDLYNRGIERGVIKVGSDNYYSFSPDVTQN